MFQYRTEKEKLSLHIDTLQLTESQVRLIRRMNSTLLELLITPKEEALFEKGQDLMKMAAMAIKLSLFISKTSSEAQPIPYAEQVIESSLEGVEEALRDHQLCLFDN